MTAKRCGIVFGAEILAEVNRIVEVNDFWKKVRGLNKIIKKASKGGFQKNRIVIVEREIQRSLSLWLGKNGIKALVCPDTEAIRNAIVSHHSTFFLFTPEEYERRPEEFAKDLKKLPHLLDISTIETGSNLSQEEVIEAVSEVAELPNCARNIVKIEHMTLANAIALLVLYRSYCSFCYDAIYCTEQKSDACKQFWANFFLALKPEFFELIKSYGIYYPVSIYMDNEFPVRAHFVDLHSYTREFGSLLNLAIFLHDSYRMGTMIYAGYSSNASEIEDVPDAYLLDYVYPLEKKLLCDRVASLILVEALKKEGNEIISFLAAVTSRMKKLPRGNEVIKAVVEFTSQIDNCYELWKFNKREVALLYSIWKMKKMLESMYQAAKSGLGATSDRKTKDILEFIYATTHEYKDFFLHDLASEIGVTNPRLVKEFFNNVEVVTKNQAQIVALDLLLKLTCPEIVPRISSSTLNYATGKVAASKLWNGLSVVAEKVEKLGPQQLVELSPYLFAYLDSPLFDADKRVHFLSLLYKKRSEQTKEVVATLGNAIFDEIITTISVSYHIDRLVNQWQRGNPLNFLKREIDSHIEESKFDDKLFKEFLAMFRSPNVLSLFRRNPDRFFEYQNTLDRYLSLELNETESWHFECFKPISSIVGLVGKLQDENKKIMLLIFDGLGFLHFCFACLECLRKGSKETKDFAELILKMYDKGKADVLSSYIPTVTGVNHIGLFFGERLLYDDSFLVRLSDDSFMSDKGEDKISISSVRNLAEADRKSTTWRDRLAESSLQKSSRLWNVASKERGLKNLLISANSENTYLSYLFRGDADFKQIDSYVNAIEEALSDRNHDLVVAQVNLMDAFLQSLNAYPPALLDDMVNGYWEVYLDLWKNIATRIFQHFKRLKRASAVIITGDHGLACGKTSDFIQTDQVFDMVENTQHEPKYRIGEIVGVGNQLIGACIPGHAPRKFMSIFLLKKGLDIRQALRNKLKLLAKANCIVFREVYIEENRRNTSIKPDFLVFPTVGVYAKPHRRKYYGGIHGGISACELFVPLIVLEK